MSLSQNNAENRSFQAMADNRKTEMDTPQLVIRPSRSINKQRELITNEDGTPNVLGLLVYYSRNFSQQATPEQARYLSASVHSANGIGELEKTETPIGRNMVRIKTGHKLGFDIARRGELWSLARQTRHRRLAKLVRQRETRLELAKQCLQAAESQYGRDSEEYIAAQLWLAEC